MCNEVFEVYIYIYVYMYTRHVATLKFNFFNYVCKDTELRKYSQFSDEKITFVIPFLLCVVFMGCQ